jgi:hypothetical protein
VPSGLRQLSFPEAVQLGLDREEAIGAEGDVVDIAAAGLGDVMVDLPATALERTQSSGDTALTAGASGPATRLLKRSPRHERSDGGEHIEDRAAVAVRLGGRHVHESNGDQGGTEAPQSESAASLARELSNTSSTSAPSHQGHHPLSPERPPDSEPVFAASGCTA